MGTTTGTVWSFTTAGDVTPPGPVTSFTATAANQQVTLSWHNPSDPDFTKTMIRYKTTGYPTSTSDGMLVIDKSNPPGSNDSYIHTNLTNGVRYYYSAFAHDAIPNYATRADTNAIAGSMICFAEYFDYPDGWLQGKGGWSGTATDQIVVENGTLRICGGSGAYDQVYLVSCGDPGSGFIWVRVKIKGVAGGNTMWSLYIDDASGLNLARWYGAASTARGRIDGLGLVTDQQTLTGGWDDLAVKIDPYANTSQFYFNGSSIGTLSHSSTGAGDVIGSLRFERLDNAGAAGNCLYFDDLIIGPETTPPAP